MMSHCDPITGQLRSPALCAEIRARVREAVKRYQPIRHRVEVAHSDSAGLLDVDDKAEAAVIAADREAVELEEMQADE